MLCRVQKTNELLKRHADKYRDAFSFVFYPSPFPVCLDIPLIYYRVLEVSYGT